MATTTPPSWVSLIITALCRGLLVMIASMALWAVLPAALGWHVTVVMSGSMEPALRPGDVVASRPISGSSVRPGQVVLVDDPDHEGRLRLHRLAKVNDHGQLVLRGDANRADDSTPVSRNAVHAVGSLRVPFIGAPAYWLRTHQLAPLLPTGLAVVLVALGAIGRRDRPDNDDNNPSEDDTDGTTDTADSSAETPSRSNEPAVLESRAQLRAARAGAARGPRTGLPRSRTLVILTTGALAAVTVATNAPAQAASLFTASTANIASSWTAAYYTCSAAVLADKPYLYYPLGESSGATAKDASGNKRNGSYYTTLGAGVSYGATGPCTRDKTTGVTLDGTIGMVSTPGPIAGPQEYTQEIWFKTTSSLGGSLIGFGNTQVLASTSYDRQLYLTTAGKLVAGAAPGGTVQTVTSAGSYNDGAWHLADVTLSSAGLTLYVDGGRVAGDSGITAAQNYSGYWRFGNSTLTGWPGAPLLGTHIAGTLHGAAIYPTALSTAQVTAHYTAR